jgi:hypothetical protein
MANDTPVVESAIVNAVYEYARRGYSIVPIPFGHKAPRVPGWPKLRISETQIPEHFANGENVGIILGQASGNLVDVDLDCPEALIAAPLFLPPTGMVHGRPSKLRSHHWYVTDAVLRPEKFCDLDGTCILELRSQGQQTVVPPSMHPSGEVLSWDANSDPLKVDADTLSRSTRRAAAAALVARHWPNSGRRNDAANALAGMLLRGNFSENESEEFLRAVANAARDEESNQRVRDVVSTQKRLVNGLSATGTPALVALIGNEVVQRARLWLGLESHAEINVAAVAREWPSSLNECAFYGLAGEIVTAVEPHTEADPAAVLIQLLVLFGNVIGRRAYFPVEGTQHFANLFAVLVGTTSKGRKGSSFSQVERLFEDIDVEWFRSRIHKGGLASGEGMIWAVHDAIERPERVNQRGEEPRYELVITDPGVSDKRLLVYEPEFATVLRVNEREGSTLSAVIREAWDSGTLASLTKNSHCKGDWITHFHRWARNERRVGALLEHY